MPQATKSTMNSTAAPDEVADEKIVVSDLSVHFDTQDGELTALDHINLSVRENEFVCIMGPSGCGKTTLLNVIAGFLAPTSGKVLVSGRLVSEPGPDRAVVFQDDVVFPWMTVEGNISYSPRMRGKSPDDVHAIVDKYVRLVGLTEFRNTWPRQLFGGMKKRVDLARCYAADPEVLLMDEPFGALDILTKEHLLEELHGIWLQAPRTMLFITHDLEEALFLGDRVILMSPRPGRIVAEYRPEFPERRDILIKTSPEFVGYVKRLRQALHSQDDQL